MSQNRILLLSPAFEDRGGVSSFCQLLTKTISSDFRIIHFPIGNRPGNRNIFKRLSYFLKDFLMFRYKLGNSSYDLVYINPSFRILSLLRDSVFLAMTKNSPAKNILVMFHGWDEALAHKIRRHHLLKRIFQNVYRKAKLILVLSQDFRNQLVELGIPANKVRIVTTMYESVQRGNESPRAGDSEKKMGLFFLGKLSKSKGVYILVKVVKRLVESGLADFHCVIAGEGPERQRLQRLIKKSGLENFIDLPGHLSGEAKWRCFEKSDIFVFPSFSEGCPIAILEAMGAGLAIVSSSVGAIPDIVRNNVNGFIVDKQNLEDFCRHIRRLMEDRHLLDNMKQLNREIAEKKFGAKFVTKQMESIFLAVLSADH